MELDVIGHVDIYPLTLQASQIFILRLLTPLAEYQDFLSFSHEKQILTILEKYINVRESRDARLAFEGLRLLASLFCHKKFTLDWVDRGGLAAFESDALHIIGHTTPSPTGLQQPLRNPQFIT